MPLTKLRRPGDTVTLKPRASALLISIVLSGLMLSVGIMSARLAVREVGISADLFLSEKAYLSAESGVEKALWLLKSEPVAHTQDTQDPRLGDTFTTTSIRNLINATPGDFPLDKFSFTLPPLSSQKFRLRQDTNPGPPTTTSSVTGPINMQLDSSGDVFWRFLCEEAGPSTTTLALQGQLNSASLVDLSTATGNTDDGTATTWNSWHTLSAPNPLPDKNTCYLSVQNLSSVDHTYTFSGTTMAPHAAHIHAKGEHQGREKHIRFDYAQKTLGSLFDFSFLHSTGGL